MVANIYDFPERNNISRKKLIARIYTFLDDPEYDEFPTLINHFVDENSLEAKEIYEDTDYIVSREEFPEKISLLSYDGEMVEISSFDGDEGDLICDLFLGYLRENEMRHRVRRRLSKRSGKVINLGSRVGA